MLALLSPSKTLDESPLMRKTKTTLPDFQEQTRVLHAVLKKKSPAEIKRLMGISDKLAELNYQRFQQFDPEDYMRNGGKPALFLFKGDVYDAMPVAQYDDKTLAYAQAHLRILSGFYGLLRPLDVIQPYRLEMGTGLVVHSAKNLYGFWSGRLSEALNTAGEGMKNPLVVNLASEEYFKAVDKKMLKLPLVHVQFREHKNGAYKIIGLMAKRARGMMANYILQQRVDMAAGLKDFTQGGYKFQPSMSQDDTLVFTR